LETTGSAYAAGAQQRWSVIRFPEPPVCMLNRLHSQPSYVQLRPTDIGRGLFVLLAKLTDLLLKKEC
jgi:hypothetical protein